MAARLRPAGGLVDDASAMRWTIGILPIDDHSDHLDDPAWVLPPLRLNLVGRGGQAA